MRIRIEAPELTLPFRNLREAFRGWRVSILVLVVGIHLFCIVSIIKPTLILKTDKNKPFICHFARDTDTASQGMDFFAIYEAGYRAWVGEDIYSMHDRPSWHAPYHSDFRYMPPIGYLLGLPLSVFPPTAAYRVWFAVNELMLIAMLITLAGVSRSPGATRRMVVFLLCFFPFIVEQWEGQFSFLMGVLMLGSLLALERGDLTRGVWIWVASVWVKHYSALMIIVWARARKLVPALIGISVLLAMSALYFYFHPESRDYFLRLNFRGRMGVGGPSLPPLYAGSFGVQQALLSIARLGRFGAKTVSLFGTPVTLYRLLVVPMVAGVLLLCTIASLRARSLTLAMAVWWPSWFFIYIQNWEHHFVMLLPLLAWLAARQVLGKWTLWGAFLFIGTPSLWFLIRERTFDVHFTDGNPLLAHRYEFLGAFYYWIKPVGLIWLQAALFRECFRESGDALMPQESAPVET